MLRRTRALTISGCIAAKRMATGPASTAARMAVRFDPAAPSTATMSSVHCSQVGMALRGTPSDAPEPRRSKAMSLLKDARRVRNPAKGGDSQKSSMWLPRP
jgi:hypothetical protein